MATMTRSNFGELLTPIHKKIFFDSYNEVPMKYQKIFKTEKMSKKDQTYPHLGAFGLWTTNTEGSDFNESDFGEGEVASFEAKRYDNSYVVTWELMQDDQYNVFKGIGKGGSAKGLGRSLRATEETDTASVILNGFTNVGYDGKALFAADHPLASNNNKVVSNLIHGALTDANLKAAMTLMRGQTDEAGIVIAASAKQLVVCPELEFTAKAIVNSILQSGTNNNDVNTIPNIEVVVWDYLVDPTGAKKPWFIQDTSLDNLLFLRREEPIFDSERIQKKMDYRMFGYTRYDCGYCDWRGLVGSTGVAETIVVPSDSSSNSGSDNSGETGSNTETNNDEETTETLGELTATVAAGSSSTATKITAVTGNGTGTLKYKVDSSITAPELDDTATGYSALTLDTDITCESGNKIIVVEVDGDNKIKKASSVLDVVVGE